MDNLQPVLNGDSQTESNEVKNMNLFQRIIGVVVSPAETMKSIIEKPKVLFPILAMAIGPVLVSIIRFPLYRDTQKEILMKTSEAMAQRFNTPVMTTAQLEQTASAGLIQGLVATPVMSVIMWLISTAIIFAILRAFGGQGKFKQYMAVTGYAYIITLIYSVLSLVVSFGTNSLKLDLSLAIFTPQLLSGSEGSFAFGMLYTILAGIGVFTIWNYVVTAIGFVQLTGLSKTKVYSIVIAFAILSIIVSGALAGLSEALTSAISAQV